VTAVDNFSTGNRGNLANLENNPGFRLVAGDILDMDGLEALIAETDVIYHLAAAVGVELVVHDPVHTLMTNVHGSSRVLSFAAEYGKRTIIASSSEVYGKSRKTSFEETDDLTIGAPTRSRWSYACSKLIDEFFLMAYVQSSNFPGTVVRFFNTVGPRQTGKYGMVVPRFVASALAGEPVRVFGTGNQTRCFCHVFDTVRALAGLADCPASHGGIYNIGSQESVSMMELAHMVIAQLGSSSKIELVPYDLAYSKGFEDMLRRLPDTGKIRSLLNWRPEHSLNQIIADVANALRRRPTC